MGHISPQFASLNHCLCSEMVKYSCVLHGDMLIITMDTSLVITNRTTSELTAESSETTFTLNWLRFKEFTWA